MLPDRDGDDLVRVSGGRDEEGDEQKVMVLNGRVGHGDGDSDVEWSSW